MGLLLLGTGLFVLAVVVVVMASLMGSTQSTGVARSLELLNQTATTQEVSKNELGVQDRVLGAAARPAARPRHAGLARRAAAAGWRATSTGRATRPAGPSSGSWAPRASAWSSASCWRCCSWASASRVWLVAAAAGAAGFFLPDLLLYNAGLKRQQELQKGLADALDMLTVCVEAGQGFDAAILQVARTVTGPIGGEFARVLSEIQIGKSRADAFASLGERTTAPELKTFVSTLVQADRLGLPVGVGAARADQGDARRPPSAGRGEGPEGHGEDPLPAAAVHLPGPVHRHHRAGRHHHESSRGVSSSACGGLLSSARRVAATTGAVTQRSTSATRPSRTAAMTALARLCAPSLS